MTGAVRGLSEIPAVPWRNGAGVTRHIVAGGAGSVAGDPAWRVSIATVEDGAAFSSFGGYERMLLPIGTGVIALRDAVGPLLPGPDGVVAFDGAAAVTATVTGGEGLALNVMVRAGHRAVVRRSLACGPVAVTEPSLRAIVVVEGAATDARGRTVPAPVVVAPGHAVTVTGVLVEILVGAPALVEDPVPVEDPVLAAAPTGSPAATTDRTTA